MGQTANELSASSADTGTVVDSAEETRLEIERTRAQMGATLDHIGERLSPERFKAEAVDAAEHLKDEALEVVGKLRLEAVDAVEQLKDDALEAAGRLKSDAIETADHLKEQAVEAARAATQEIVRGIKEAIWETYDGARARIQETTNAIEDSVKGVTSTILETITENPIPVAIAGFGLFWLYRSLNQEESIKVNRANRIFH
jgi:hypothetical protein